MFIEKIQHKIYAKKSEKNFVKQFQNKIAKKTQAKTKRKEYELDKNLSLAYEASQQIESQKNLRSSKHSVEQQ